jgi:hypothetical protein
MNVVPWIIAIISFVTATFLGTEMLKKFNFMRHFMHCPYERVSIVEWKYSGDRKPGMYNIVIHTGSPLGVLLGFDLKFLKYVGFDYYGFVESKHTGRVVISTYLGTGETTFRFLVKHRDGEATVSVDDFYRQHFPTLSTHHTGGNGSDFGARPSHYCEVFL